MLCKCKETLHVFVLKPAYCIVNWACLQGASILHHETRSFQTCACTCVSTKLAFKSCLQTLMVGLRGPCLRCCLFVLGSRGPLQEEVSQHQGYVKEHFLEKTTPFKSLVNERGVDNHRTATCGYFCKFLTQRCSKSWQQPFLRTICPSVAIK